MALQPFTFFNELQFDISPEHFVLFLFFVDELIFPLHLDGGK
jgi:hypothetical protein